MNKEVRERKIDALVVLVALVVFLYFYTESANAQGFFGLGADSASEMVCTVDGEVVDCPGEPPTAMETVENKIVHATGILIFLALVLLARAPGIRELIVPHRDLDDILEKELKEKFASRAAKRPTLTDAESRVASALAWKNTLSYAAVVLAGVWVLVAL